jgi:hypothetical protein
MWEIGELAWYVRNGRNVPQALVQIVEKFDKDVLRVKFLNDVLILGQAGNAFLRNQIVTVSQDKLKKV